MDEGLSLIMIDKMDGDTLLGPQYIIGINRQQIPVYIGHYVDAERKEVEKEERIVGLWVKSTDYHSIDHNKMYVFIHDYDMPDDAVNSTMDKIEENINNIEIPELDALDNAHYHIGIPLDDQLKGFSQEYIQ